MTSVPLAASSMFRVRDKVKVSVISFGNDTLIPHGNEFDS